jgi:very-short-patch-repair endonuclease
MTEERRPQFTSSPQQWDKLKPRAREMRRAPTPAEDALWQSLRSRRLAGAKFRRQHAIGGFIVDFVCVERRLIVEVDGEIHQQPGTQAYDAERQAALGALGFRVLRFDNAQVLAEPVGVLAVIAEALGVSTSP